MNQNVNPEMVTLARESRGLSQSELAKRLVVSQGKISKIEHGLLGVSDELLLKLSETLNYPPHFFSLNEPLHGGGFGVIYHRKRQSLSVKDSARIQAEINIRRIHVTRLLRSVDFKPPKISRLDIDDFNGSIEEITAQVRAAWLLPRGPIKNLTQAFENAGGMIIRCDFGTGLIDAVSQWIDGLPPMIFINAGLPGDRVRFTVAHEIGHLVMHQIPTSNIEDEANRFAGALLMPATDIGPDLTTLSLPKLARLKVYWKVAMTALLLRASHLNKISERQERYLWMQLSKAGYRTQEPPELDIPVEAPRLLEELIEVHRNELQYSVSELSHALAVNDHEFESRYLHEQFRTHTSNQASFSAKGKVLDFKRRTPPTSE